jgi:hypothetical protein
MEGNCLNRDESRLLPAAWWHFERYVVSDGVIRPAPGARGERYDPWEAFQEGRRGRPRVRLTSRPDLAAPTSPRRRVELPYQLLMSIAHEYSWAPARRGRGRPRQTEEQLLAWCGKNGLLGLLHHQLLAARIPPRRDERDKIAGMVIERTASGWTSQTLPTSQRRSRGRAAAQLATMLPEGTVMRWFPTEELRWESFGGEWSHYFAPESPLHSPEATRSYLTDEDEIEQMPPLPTEEAFWREYGEPLPNFVEAGMRLADAVDLIREGRQTEEKVTKEAPARDRELIRRGQREELARVRSRDENLIELARQRRRWGVRALSNLTGPVTPTLSSGQDRDEYLRWSAPSLLGSLALMAMSDISGGARVISCARCGAPTITQSHRGAYCSARCRDR